MKKTVFLFLALLMPALVVYSDPIDIRKTANQRPDGPRTSSPSVSADMENGLITVDINRYLGNASVKINNEDGETLLTNIAYISGHTAFTTSVSQLTSGSYTILIELEDGTAYIGSFNIAE